MDTFGKRTSPQVIVSSRRNAPFAGIVAAIDFSRKTLRLMRQNIFLAITYNFLAVPIAIVGFVTPLIAAAAMPDSSILVMLNALRARSAGGEKQPAAGADGFAQARVLSVGES